MKKIVDIIVEVVCAVAEVFLPRPLFGLEGYCDKYDNKPYVDPDDVR